jgi:SAM-dependent methyltransferase
MDRPIPGAAADQHRGSRPHAAGLTYSPAIADARNYTAWVLTEFAPYLGGKVLEIGVGPASYYEAIAARADYIGVDIDPHAIAAASHRYPAGRFRTADITDPQFVDQFAAERPDAILCCNVLEHILDDSRAVRHLAAVLRPAGRLLVFVPAVPLLFNDLDRLAGHERRYGRKALRAALSAPGLDVEHLSYFNPIGGIGWLVNRLRRHRSLDAHAIERQIVLFDRYLIPMSRALNPLTRHVFGQSLVAVAKKR